MNSKKYIPAGVMWLDLPEEGKIEASECKSIKQVLDLMRARPQQNMVGDNQDNSHIFENTQV